MTETLRILSPFATPVRLTQAFGGNPQYYSRFRYNGVPLKGHNGLDFGVAVGTPVQAVDNGVVVEVAFEAGGFGNYIKLLHTWGQSLYAHLNVQGVEVGDHVVAGQVIALSGNTGGSTGPHLHFAVRLSPDNHRGDGWGGYVDPMPFLPGNAIESTRGLVGIVTPIPPSAMIEGGEV